MIASQMPALICAFPIRVLFLHPYCFLAPIRNVAASCTGDLRPLFETTRRTIGLHCWVASGRLEAPVTKLSADSGRGPKRNFNPHRGSVPLLAVELECPVQLKHTFSHIDHPKPSRFPRLVGIAANAVIGD